MFMLKAAEDKDRLSKKPTRRTLLAIERGFHAAFSLNRLNYFVSLLVLLKVPAGCHGAAG